MRNTKFALDLLVRVLAWIGIFVWVGYVISSMPVMGSHPGLVALGIAGVSLLFLRFVVLRGSRSTGRPGGRPLLHQSLAAVALQPIGSSFHSWRGTETRSPETRRALVDLSGVDGRG